MYYPFILGTYVSGLLIYLVIVLAFLAAGIVGGWLVYKKAGKEGWAAIIPVYTSYVLYEITWGNGVLGLIYVGLVVIGALDWPIIGSLCLLVGAVLKIVTAYKLAKSFGKGIPFTIGLALLSPIFLLILGLSKDTYKGVPQDGYTYDDLKSKISAHMNSDAPANDSARPDSTSNSSQTDTDSSTEHEDAAPSTQPDAEEATENADTQSATQPEEKTAGE